MLTVDKLGRRVTDLDVFTHNGKYRLRASSTNVNILKKKEVHDVLHVHCLNDS